MNIPSPFPRNYHSECFNCMECSCNLTGERYLQNKDGITYCHPCYLTMTY